MYAVAHALHNMRTEVCGQGSIGLCDEMRPPNMDAFFEYLTNVSFKGKIIVILLPLTRLFLLLLLFIIIIIIIIIVIIIIIISYSRAVRPTVYTSFITIRKVVLSSEMGGLNVKFRTS